MEGSVKGRRGLRLPRLLERGEPLIASAGLGVAVVLLALVVGSALWSGWTQRDALESARTRELHAVGSSLAETIADLIVVDELSAVRRHLINAARAHGFHAGRLVLPDGQIVAHTDASKISLIALPPSWDPDDTGAAALPPMARARHRGAAPGDDHSRRG